MDTLPMAPIRFLGAAARIWASDIRAAAGSWMAFVLTMGVAGTGVAVALALLIEGTGDSAELGGTILGMALFSVAATTATIAGLILNERRPVYAQWKLAGMPGLAVSVLLVLQFAAVAALGAGIGALPAQFLIAPGAQLMKQEGLSLGDPWLSPLVWWITVIVCASAALAGVLGRTLVIGWQKPMRTSQSATVPRAKPSVLLSCVFAIFVGSTIAIGLTEDLTENPGSVVGFTLLFSMSMVFGVDWFIHPLLQWTRVLELCGPVARVAIGNIRVRSAFSAAQFTPWLLVAGLTVGVGSSLEVLMQHTSGSYSSPPEVIAALFSPMVVPPLVAALTTQLILRPRTIQDDVILYRCGASFRQRWAVKAWESTAVVATVGLVAAGLGVAGVACTNLALLGQAFPAGWWESVLWQPLLWILLAMWLLNLTVASGIWGHITKIYASDPRRDYR